VTISTAPPDPASPPALLDVRAVAQLLACSPRHVYRLSDAGRMPPPVKIGALVRWPRQTVEEWIKTGCKPVRQAGRA
jgi:excisionase family DNA binding protein